MVEPKPEFLGQQFAASFEDASVAAAYRYRPPFPPQTFEILNRLIRDEPRRVLDAGCGTGALTRHLAGMVEQVDAVDVSRAMIEQGQQMPDGRRPNIRWIVGRVEDAPLEPPYSLITAANSLHWMDWAAVMPLFRRLLSPNGVLAIIDMDSNPPPWHGALLGIIRRYSINQGYQPYNLVDELVRRGLFTETGRERTPNVPFEQRLEEYVESFHARSAFSRERMTARNAAAFDQAIRGLVRRYEPDLVHLEVSAAVYWGLPHAAGESYIQA